MRKRFLVKLELAKKSVSVLLTFGQTVVAKVNTASSTFTTPTPALADISSALADLSTAINNAAQGGVEETQIQTVARISVENLLAALGHYVEDVANDPANATPLELPLQIIDSAGMQVRGFSPSQKHVFKAKAGKLPGEVDLVAGGVIRGFHEWQYTLTPDNADSWTDLTSTTKAKTTAIGLTVLTVYFFRHRAVLKSGVEPWEDPVSLVVL